MEHEIIDQLDETGKFIGTVEKMIAHRDGLWHKSVHVWIINDNNEILLQKRCSNKDFYPNVWDVSFAGHVSAGEDSLTSAVREGKEELGIEIDCRKLKYLFTNKEKINYKEIRSNEFIDVYLLKQNIDLNDIILQEEEVSDIKYLKIPDFFEMIFSKDNNLFPHVNEYEQLQKYLE